MTSILGTQSIQHPNGTASATVSADGTFSSPGHVIQVVNSTLAGGGDVTTSTSYISTGNTVSITPKFSNSKIFVSFSHVIRVTPGSTHTRADLRIRETTTDTTAWVTLYMGEELTDGGKDPIQQVGASFVYTTPDTNAKTFLLEIRKANANSAESGNIYYKWYTGSVHNMTAMEIAQ